MSNITFSGLSSGLDTSSMVSSLVKNAKIPATALETKQSNLTSQKSILSSLSSSLSSLTTAMKGLDLASEVKPNTATVSDDHVGVTTSSSADVGTHDIRVTSLAASSINQSRSFASAAAGAAGAGGLAITVGSGTKSVSWDATDSLSSIASKINGADAGVSASVVKVTEGSYRLVVSAKETGTTKAPSFVMTGDSLGLNDSGNVKRAAADAQLTVDGIDITRSSNSISDVLSGVTLSLKSVHGADEPNAMATVSQDTTAVQKSLQTFVDAYNKINSQLHTQLDYTGTAKGQNTLFGDSTLRGIQGSLATMMSSSYGGSSLAAIGISRDKTGVMSIDATKLTAALGKDPNAVSKVFVDGGLAKAITERATGYTQAGGILATKSDAMTARSKIYQDSIERINTNADALQTRLEKQFTAMEKAISNMKSQSSSLSQLFQSSSS